MDNGQSQLREEESLAFRPVTRRNAADFESLFAAPGAPKYCWCMAWRRTPAEAKKTDPASSKRQMMKRIGEGTPVGLLAYDGKVPVAWVSIAPRDTYRLLGGPAAKPGETIWSLACFFVPRTLRRHGMMRRLIAAAVDHARAKGATIVEAYPVESDSPSYRFMGFVPVFDDAGFAEVARAGSRRHVMRLSLPRKRKAGKGARSAVPTRLSVYQQARGHAAFRSFAHPTRYPPPDAPRCRP